jgi:AcrR family transcriptional regulator
MSLKTTVKNSVKKQPKQTAREKILEAALKLFSLKGYTGATTKDISKEAKVAEVTLFRHFSSKEVLFEGVLTNYSFLPTLKNTLPEIRGISYEDALSLLALRFLEMLRLRKDFIKIMQTEFRTYPEKIHQIYFGFISEMFRYLSSYFDELQAVGKLRAFDTTLAARAFFGMFFSYFNATEYMMLRKYMPDNEKDTVREYISIFINGTAKF